MQTKRTSRLSKILGLAILGFLIQMPVSLQTAKAQRTARDIGRSPARSTQCRKETVVVDGLRRVRCKKSATKTKKRNASGSEHTRARKECKTVGGKRNCSWITYFQGKPVGKKQLRTTQLRRPTGNVWVYSMHHKEEFKLNLFDRSGHLNDTSLAALDDGFRCRRTLQTRAVDSRLYVILSHIQDNWPRKRIDLVSGFRFQTNEGSRHFHASAMDIRISGVDAKEIYDYAESLDTGGMGIGIYPYAGFVHIDFRAPGEPSYRWRDISPKNYAERGKEVSDKFRNK